MKKIIFSVYIVVLLSLGGCYDGSGDAVVKINLGNIPLARQEHKSFIDKFMMFFESRAYAQAAPGDVIKIHVAALQDDSIIATASFNVPSEINGEYVDIAVPPGKNITVIIIGENQTYVNDEPVNAAGYYGYTTLDLIAGETVTAQITAAYMNQFMNLSRQTSVIPYYIYWDKIPGAVIHIDDGTNTIYDGTGTRVNVIDYGASFNMRADFQFAGVSSITQQFGW